LGLLKYKLHRTTQVLCYCCAWAFLKAWSLIFFLFHHVYLSKVFGIFALVCDKNSNKHKAWERCVQVYKKIYDQKENLEMKNFIAIIILMFSMNSFSQELKEKNWILKVNTTQLIDAFSFPTVQISVERKLKPYLSVNAEFGYQLYEFKTEIDTTVLKPKGFKANIELRCYFQKLLKSRNISNRNELFVGIQIFYRQNQKSNSLEYRRIDNEVNPIYFDDNFGVKKSAKGINLTFGDQISISKKIILEPYIVIGYMDRKIENFELEYNKEKHIADRNDGIPILVRYDIEDESKQNVNFGFGLRIGYKL
jgi:hypothetical protein